MEAYKHPVVDQSIDSSYDACKCVYIDNAQPERQEIVSDRLQELTPLIDLNPEHTQAAANCSLFYESSIVKHLLKIYGEQDVEFEGLTHPIKKQTVQLFIIRGFQVMISALKKDYIDFLKKEDILEDFFRHLSNGASEQSAKESEYLMPIENLEMQVNKMRTMVMSDVMAQMTLSPCNELLIVPSEDR